MTIDEPGKINALILLRPGSIASAIKMLSWVVMLRKSMSSVSIGGGAPGFGVGATGSKEEAPLPPCKESSQGNYSNSTASVVWTSWEGADRVAEMEYGWTSVYGSIAGGFGLAGHTSGTPEKRLILMIGSTFRPYLNLQFALATIEYGWKNEKIERDVFL